MRAAPLHTRPDHIALSRIGGYRAAQLRAERPAWVKSFYATLQAMRRWDPDNPILSMDRVERNKLIQAVWEAGYQAGAGYKRS